nr:hypothetical protein [Tanacetum cinerariifolium]
MTKEIEGDFEKLKDLKIKDISLTYDTLLEIFNKEFNRMSRMDDDLFTYEVEIDKIYCDQNKDDDSEQHVSREANDDIGDDEVELTDEESSDNENEIAEVFRIDTNISNFETHMCKAFKEFNYLFQIDPDLLTKKRKWESHEITYHDHDEMEYGNETHNERQELCEAHKLPVCTIRRFEMIKYSFGQDKEYVVVKKDEYNDLARTSKDACRAYQEIFHMMDEG